MPTPEPSAQIIQGYGHVFSRNPLDRGEKERRDESKIQQMAIHSDSRFLPLRNLDLLVETSNTPRLKWLEQSQFNKYNPDGKAIFLGFMDGIYHYAFEVSIEILSDFELRTINPNLSFVDVRTCGHMLPREDAGIAAQARIQTYWHQQYKFCPVCGFETTMKRGGQARSCGNCSKDNIPRTAPDIIVVVHDGDTFHNRTDVSDKELAEFVDSFNTEQLQSLMQFFETMPKVRHVINVTNPNTKVTSEMTLEGMETFLV